MTHSHPTTPFLSRRHLLAGAAATPLALTGLRGASAQSAAPSDTLGFAPYRRFNLGGFTVTTILAGTRTVPDPHTIFGLNASEEEFTTLSEANFIPVDATQFFFTPTVVDTGSDVILFDTGLDPAGLTGALESSGYSADAITRVVITHMHGDHIGGLYGDAPTFANAAYTTGAVEMDHWSNAGNDGFEAKVRPMMDQFDLLEDGGEVVSGVTAMAAFGHTPGHMAYHLESEGERLLLGADFANHYVWSLARPEWEVRFDMDKGTAAETRKSLLEMLATDRIPFVGYHMPFPAVGYVDRRDGAYHYMPMTYQKMIDTQA